jgi:hypothetical protein
LASPDAGPGAAGPSSIVALLAASEEQVNAPAAKRGRAMLTGDEWLPSLATRWGQTHSRSVSSGIVN